jgi:hypothetical protein
MKEQTMPPRITQSQIVNEIISKSKDTSTLAIAGITARRHLDGYPGGQSPFEARFAAAMKEAQVPSDFLDRFAHTVLVGHRNEILPKVALTEARSHDVKRPVPAAYTLSSLRHRASVMAEPLVVSPKVTLPVTIRQKYTIRLMALKSLRYADDGGWEYGPDREEPFIVWSCFGPSYQRSGVTEEPPSGLKQNQQYLFQSDQVAFSSAPGTMAPAALPGNPLVLLYQVIENDDGGPSKEQFRKLAAHGAALSKAIAAEDWATVGTVGADALIEVYGIAVAISAGGDDYYPVMIATFDNDRLLQLTSGTGPGPLDQDIFHSQGSYKKFAIRIANIEGGWKVAYAINRA